MIDYHAIHSESDSDIENLNLIFLACFYLSKHFEVNSKLLLEMSVSPKKSMLKIKQNLICVFEFILCEST